MSLYNMVFGHQPAAPPLIGLILSKDPTVPTRASDMIPRLRDAWVEKDGDQILIRVMTRLGGGNRPDYATAIETIRNHPWYVRDEDQEFDSTYADFYFRPDLSDVDPELATALVEHAVEHVDMTERWNEAFETLRQGREDDG
jgi:hypothetical protein